MFLSLLSPELPAAAGYRVPDQSLWSPDSRYLAVTLVRDAPAARARGSCGSVLHTYWAMASWLDAWLRPEAR